MIMKKIKLKKLSLITIVCFIISGITLFSLGSCDNKSKIENEKKIAFQKEIEILLEDVYNQFSNGILAQNIDKFPFYNSDTDSMLKLYLYPVFIMNNHVLIECKSVTILSYNDKEAIIHYDLILTRKSKLLIPIDMKLKKIGGRWRIDLQKFFPCNKYKEKIYSI